MATFYDNFNDNTLTGWVTDIQGAGGTISEVNDRLECITPNNAVSAMYVTASTPFSLRNDNIFIEVPQILPFRPNVFTAFRYGIFDGTANGNVGILAYQSGTDRLGFIMSALNGVQGNVIATVPYNSTTHRWWRIREYGNILYGEVSEDSNVWVHPDGLDSTNTEWKLSVELFGGWTPDNSPVTLMAFSNDATYASSTAIFDNYNVTRAPSLANLSITTNVTAQATAIQESPIKTSGVVALSITTSMAAAATKVGSGTIKVSDAVALSITTNVTAEAVRKLQHTVMPAISLSAGFQLSIIVADTQMRVLPAAYKAFIDSSYHIEQLLLLTLVNGYSLAQLTESNRSFMLPIPALRNPDTGDQLISYRFGKGNSGAGSTAILVTLFEGDDKAIAAWEHENIPIVSSVVTQTLTEEQIRTITNYQNLSLRFTVF